MRMQMAFGPMLDVGISGVSLGDVFKSIVQMMEQYGVPSPQELMLVTKQLLYFERYARVHAPTWALARDVFLVKNIFPEDAAKKAADSASSSPTDDGKREGQEQFEQLPRRSRRWWVGWKPVRRATLVIADVNRSSSCFETVKSSTAPHVEQMRWW